MKTDTRSNHEVARDLFAVLFPAAMLGKALVGGDHPPMLAVEFTDGKLDVMCCIGKFSGPAEAQAFAAHLTLEDRDVRAACLITEVYAARIRKDDPRHEEIRAGRMQPKDLPESAEAVLFDIRVGGSRFLVQCVTEDGVLVPGEVEDYTNRSVHETMPAKIAA